ncbi:hypothetical protein NXW62_13345 [Bacteroides fragilis]|nr:hypothetical protein [Bacteroides fragilis]
MEYYGKILCISYNDLTYDDRPVMVNGKADYSRSRTLKGVHPSTLSEEELAPIMSIPNYKKLAAKEKINVVRSGRGLGGYVLVEIATMPLRFQERIKLKIRRYERRRNKKLARQPLPHRYESPGILHPVPF